MKNRRSAFTLVELSIVLVILGLLVGGVLTGQSLIRAAEIRSVVTQQNRYVAAAQTFRDKYFALPGDMTNATSFWGTAAGGASCVTTAGTGTQTCNGDGDGRVVSSTNSAEHFRFWQHLANAGLIEGTYTGILSASNGNSSSSANSPVGKISTGLWHARNWDTLTSNTIVFDGTYNNFLLFGTFTTDSPPFNPIFKPEEAWNLDTKMDDGMPATGKMVALSNGGFSTCTTASASTTLSAAYLLSSTSITCAAVWRQVF